MTISECIVCGLIIAGKIGGLTLLVVLTCAVAKFHIFNFESAIWQVQAGEVGKSADFIGA
ncbi:MAG TPA: hypothetical protein DCM28_15550 [Phycisphaerales bacterium]|nr:hypothetical protein [Phycisphaerales bacterium]HCD33732.1 hypothetical protein [Phycisphaerales bacterium]